MHCTYKEDVGRWEQECAALQDTVQVWLSCLRLRRRCCAVDRCMGPDPDPAGASVLCLAWLGMPSYGFVLLPTTLLTHLTSTHIPRFLRTVDRALRSSSRALLRPWQRLQLWPPPPPPSPCTPAHTPQWPRSTSTPPAVTSGTNDTGDGASLGAVVETEHVVATAGAGARVRVPAAAAAQAPATPTAPAAAATPPSAPSPSSWCTRSRS